MMSYKEQIAHALQRLDSFNEKDHLSMYLNLNDVFTDMDGVPTTPPMPIKERTLRNYSTKLDKMLRNILEGTKGSNLVYSQFKTVEGLGVLSIALKANGFVPIDIVGSDQNPTFSRRTEASFRKGPDAGEKRYIMFTGEGSKERRTLILNLFNGQFDKLPASMRSILEESGYTTRKNTRGELCWVIGITGAGAEGISLKCCRKVHIMEPYWNNVRLDQVKGRAIRICSHKELPFEDRTVEIYTYVTQFSERQFQERLVDQTLLNSDKGKTSDQNVWEVSKKKDKINNEILELMKECAMDCGLNAADNQDVKCLFIDGRPDQAMFDPNLEIDKLTTSIEMKAKPARAVSQEDTTSNVRVVQYRGHRYFMYPRKNGGRVIFDLFAMSDQLLQRPVGEVQVDPTDENRIITGRLFDVAASAVGVAEVLEEEKTD